MTLPYLHLGNQLSSSIMDHLPSSDTIELLPQNLQQPTDANPKNSFRQSSPSSHSQQNDSHYNEQRFFDQSENHDSIGNKQHLDFIQMRQNDLNLERFAYSGPLTKNHGESDELTELHREQSSYLEQGSQAFSQWNEEFSQGQHDTHSHEQHMSSDDFQDNLSIRGKCIQPERRCFANAQFYVTRGWHLEFISILSSVLCFIALAIMLSRIDGQLLSSWTAVVSPNTFISVLSTSSKALLIFPVAEAISQLKWHHLASNAGSIHDIQGFENASRGPWGSVSFLWSSRSRSPVAYIGCVVTFTAIAFEPFTQTILEYRQQDTIMKDRPSNVTRSQTYSNGLEGSENVRGLRDGPRDRKMIGAIRNAWYEVVPTPPFFCPGMRCDYPLFTSWSAWGRCRDTTAQSSVGCICMNYNGDHRTQCDIRTPSFVFQKRTSSACNDTSFDPPLASSSIHSRGSHQLWLAIGIFQTRDANIFQDWKHWQQSLHTFECELEIGVTEYSNYTMVNGTLEKGHQRQVSLDFTAYDNATNFVQYRPVDAGFLEEQSFHLDLLDELNIFNALEEILNVEETGTDSALSEVYALTDSPNIPAMVDNLATAISYRMLSGPQAEIINGSAYLPETYMKVHWKWLSLPAALIIVGVLFLIIVMVAIKRANQRIWKSSLIPLLIMDESQLGGSRKSKTVSWTQEQQTERKKMIRTYCEKP